MIKQLRILEIEITKFIGIHTTFWHPQIQERIVTMSRNGRYLKCVGRNGRINIAGRVGSRWAIRIFVALDSIWHNASGRWKISLSNYEFDTTVTHFINLITAKNLFGLIKFVASFLGHESLKSSKYRVWKLCFRQVRKMFTHSVKLQLKIEMDSDVSGNEFSEWFKEPLTRD